MVLPLVLAIVLAFASPVAAEVFDFSWSSTTFFVPRDGSGVSLGGTVSGRDPSATWDRDSSTLRWTADGHAFGGTLLRSGEHEWNQVIAVPTHPATAAATGRNTESNLILRETQEGFTLSGHFGSMFDFGDFSGIGRSARALTAAEPSDGLLLLVTVSLAVAIVLRRQGSLIRKRPE